MLINTKTYTVESVTSGHPDKICDQVSDCILDTCLSQDPQSRVAIECLGAHGLFIIAGELTTKAEFNATKIARKVYKDIGYKDKLKIISEIAKQSPDIAQGVNSGGAGDQGIMYGYATNETAQYLPKAVVWVHSLTKGLEELRKKSRIPWLRPDGKAQITIKNSAIHTVLVSCQHHPSVSQTEIKKQLIQKLIEPTIAQHIPNIYINPTGKFILGGFEADSGLTGRKIMVDTYGGIVPHGGGCFSGKDPSKVDRSGAYMARFAAKNIVAKGKAKECLVAVSYAIGKSEPLMVEARDEKGRSLNTYVQKHFDFRPRAIIERLNLLQPIYQQTATYGHFGKSNLPWEKIE